jgi:hypothetical protein
VLASIVEGDGEVGALPLLLRRVAADRLDRVEVRRPVRIKRQRVGHEGELEKFVHICKADIDDHGGDGVVLLVLDADEDCPATLGPALLARMRAVLGDKYPAVVAFAVKRYETWLVAGHADAAWTTEQGAPSKNWFHEREGRYSETVDQPRITAKIDLDLAQSRCESLARLIRYVRELT